MGKKEILDYINNIVVSEHGKRATMASTLRDLELDSFGYTVLFIDLDSEFGYFSDVPADVDAFTTVEWDTITIEEVINKCM